MRRIRSQGSMMRKVIAARSQSAGFLSSGALVDEVLV